MVAVLTRPATRTLKPSDEGAIYEILRAGGSMTPKEVASILQVRFADVEAYLEFEAISGVIQHRDGGYSAWR